MTKVWFTPPQVPPELIPLLDVSFDENLSEIMDEFDQNSLSAEHNHETVASENTVVNLNPKRTFSQPEFKRGGIIHFKPRKRKHSKENSKRCKSCKKIPENEK